MYWHKELHMRTLSVCCFLLKWQPFLRSICCPESIWLQQGRWFLRKQCWAYREKWITVAMKREKNVSMLETVLEKLPLRKHFSQDMRELRPPAHPHIFAFMTLPNGIVVKTSTEKIDFHQGQRTSLRPNSRLPCNMNCGWIVSDGDIHCCHLKRKTSSLSWFFERRRNRQFCFNSGYFTANIDTPKHQLSLDVFVTRRVLKNRRIIGA